MTVSIHESGRTLFPGTGFIDEVADGRRAGHGRERAARGVHRGGGLARGGRGDRSPRRRAFPAGHRRQPARRRHARLGPPGPPSRHDDRDGRGGPDRRRGRPSPRRRPLARDRRRRLRRVPGRAPDVGARLARGRPSPRSARRARPRPGASGGPPMRRRSALRAMPERFDDEPHVGGEHDRHAQIANAASRRAIEHVMRRGWVARLSPDPRRRAPCEVFILIRAAIAAVVLARGCARHGGIGSSSARPCDVRDVLPAERPPNVAGIGPVPGARHRQWLRQTARALGRVHTEGRTVHPIGRTTSGGKSERCPDFAAMRSPWRRSRPSCCSTSTTHG